MDRTVIKKNVLWQRDFVESLTGKGELVSVLLLRELLLREIMAFLGKLT